MAFVHEDITARKRAEEQLRQFAHFDQLSGLANRYAMNERLENLLAGGTRQVSIALLDLDGFKEVDDTLRHSTGDRLLMQVAGRLRSAVAARAPGARWPVALAATNSSSSCRIAARHSQCPR